MSKRLKVILLIITICVIGILVFNIINSPKYEVNKLCKAIKNFDKVKINTLVEGDDLFNTSEEANQNFMSEDVTKYFKENVKDLKYDIDNIEIENDKATVKVRFTYIDAGDIFLEACGEYTQKAFQLAFSGMSNDGMNDIFQSVVEQKLKESEPKESKVTVEIECAKQGNKWKIQSLSDKTHYEIVNIMSCGIIKKADYFGGVSDDSIDEEVTEYNWSDIPLGKELELATINMTIRKCTETYKLTADYVDTQYAPDGSKFIVIDVVIENTTKSTLNFNNDIYLYDSNDREYAPYSAVMYFDETFLYTDLAPNIKTKGTMVYNIPNDAKDYYLVTAKAGTNEAYRLMLK